MNDVELEVFRADTRASRGITSAAIADLAATYDPETAPAACCIGHPKNDTPALGKITGFRADGNRLFAKLTGIKDELVNGIKDGSLLNRSMAFFSPDHEANPKPGKLYPRHLGFLGASAPGIPGMSNLKAALSFSATDELEVDGDPAPAVMFESEPDPTLVFTVKETTTVDPANKEPTADDLKAREDAIAKRESEFAAREETARKDRANLLVDGLIASGKLLPAFESRAKLVFSALSPEPLEFEAGQPHRDPAAELAAIISEGGVKLVPVDETPTGKRTEFSADDGKDPHKIEAAARELMDKNKSLTFEAAVEQVTSKGA